MKGTTNVPSAYTVIRRDGKIAFVLRSNTGFADGLYSLPAGHVENLESFRMAAAREANEEVGAIIALPDLRYVHTMHRHKGDHIRVDVFFEADDWTGDLRNMLPNEHSEMVWLDEANLPHDKIMDFQAKALQHISEGQLYSELGWEDASTA